MKYSNLILFSVALATCISCSQSPPSGPSSNAKADVSFADGHETDPQDRGRPVVLIAAALGVKTQVFRDAFSGVTPARNGKPTADHARANKQVLMAALSPHGITNERLDEVSNYYRYQPQDGGLWRHGEAKATAIVTEGKVTGFEIADAGHGYSTPPNVSVSGFPNLKIKVTLGFSEKMAENGRVTALEIQAN